MSFNNTRYQGLQRQCPDCTIVVVTKYQDVMTTQAVVDANVKHIAEAKVQDAIKKKEALTGDFTYHMIGHLQSNKAKEAVALFDMIQSVDSIKLIDKLQKESRQQKKNLPILLQANFTNETNKWGFPLATIHQAILHAQDQPNLDLQGCMCMGKQDDEQVTRLCFQWLKHICDYYDLPICSMGMSHDWPLAYEIGSTMLRIGSAVFDE